MRSTFSNFYIYQIRDANKAVTGIVANLSIKDIGTNVQVLAHESLEYEKVGRYERYLRREKQQGNPSILFYAEPQKEIKDIIESVVNNCLPNKKILNEGVEHLLWDIESEIAIKHLAKHMHDIKKLYIADGHHRYAACLNAAKIEQSIESFLCWIVPGEDLTIVPYQRIFRILGATDNAEIMETIAQRFTLLPHNADNVEALLFYANNELFCIKCKECQHEDVLEISVCVDKHLREIENIEIDLINKDRGECLQIMRENKLKFGMLMPDISVNTIVKTADKHQLLPVNFTCFSPKPINKIDAVSYAALQLDGCVSRTV